MPELNFSFQPARREQVATNKKVSQYVLADLSTQYVGKLSSTAWAIPTGTPERSTFATYSAPTISAAYTQSEVQAIADHVQVLSRRVMALITDLTTAGGI